MLHVRVEERGVLLGCMIGAIAGIAWSVWGASGLMQRTVAVAVVVAVVGVIIGALILIPILGTLRQTSAPASVDAPRSTLAFSSLRYRVTVIVEAVAIVAGVLFLGTINQPSFIPPWIAIVVGVHFLSFARSWKGFYVPSIALIIAGVAGAVVGFAGGRSGDVTATVGIIAAISLFCSAARAFFTTSDTASQNRAS